jgi:hypothetical protein
MFDVVRVHADFDQHVRLPPHPPGVGKRGRRLDVDEPLPLEDVTVLAESTGEAARVDVRGGSSCRRLPDGVIRVERAHRTVPAVDHRPPDVDNQILYANLSWKWRVSSGHTCGSWPGISW